ncbi:PLP-dependent aminotransferase family protein [Dactylosporangium sp. AC04546]|uniref:aminotransferase-like domain-containing protein n=1 Tax=Dactylosporangium sp. AC04546 TaxID=2862460 RepID=UPI001EDE5787|nr:PLP-dependent aminotransferase family protein [Dactylosporangium sp. AC04546]WVK80491.1 PLP-dependent aminotransferase family protein [Dactylosporangium sp. AC04546]
MTAAAEEASGLTALARGLSAPKGFVEASLAAAAPGAIRLLGGIPAPEALPVDAIGAASARLWQDVGGALAGLQYSAAPGSAALRDWIASREGVDPRRIVVTNGGMHGLALAVLTVVERDATVAVDDPVFPGFLWALEVATTRLLPVPVAADGFDVEHLARRLAAGARIAAAYTVPDFHNPAQVSLSAAKRQALIALAERHGFYVIVDNPYRALRFAGRDQGAAVFNDSDRAIHVNTFTKTLGPGWRVGWLVLPEHLVDPVVRLRNRLDVHTSSVTQAILERLLTDDAGSFDRIVRGAVALYRERAGVLVDALREHLPGALDVVPPEGGLFLWPRLTDDAVDPAALFRRAAAHGVVYQPGEVFAAGPERRRSARHLRFAYSDRTPHELREAVRRLALAFEDV